MKVAVLQMASGEDKRANLEKAARMVREAAVRGAELAVLPELFNFLPRRMEKDWCLPNAEGEEGETIRRLKEISKEEGMAIVAGSIIEREGERLYNTAFVLAEGEAVGKYRKNHLFNYGKINESQVFAAGDSPAVLDLLGAKVGITICYDLRFPELFRAEALLGAEVIVNAAAFLEETGRAHWMPLLRARAIENQAYIIAANQAGAEENRFRYYGHSCIIDPWGRVVRRAGSEEGIIIGCLRRERVMAAREKIPILKDYKEY
uniref:Carbon-nitrogen hydrolase family protein n=1 Tax=Candidatus Methanosuratincola petrocarbonis (ex Vanwonterghem et al. 2016) TaxID=1867261 RepID=A0A7J3UYG9_9CREN